MYPFSKHLDQYVTPRDKINLKIRHIRPLRVDHLIWGCKWRSVICFSNCLNYSRALDDVLNILKLTSKPERTIYRKAGWIIVDHGFIGISESRK